MHSERDTYQNNIPPPDRESPQKTSQIINLISLLGPQYQNVLTQATNYVIQIRCSHNPAEISLATTKLLQLGLAHPELYQSMDFPSTPAHLVAGIQGFSPSEVITSAVVSAIKNDTDPHLLLIQNSPSDCHSTNKADTNNKEKDRSPKPERRPRRPQDYEKHKTDYLSIGPGQKKILDCLTAINSQPAIVGKMHYEQELSLAQISQQLDISPDNTKRSLRIFNHLLDIERLDPNKNDYPTLRKKVAYWLVILQPKPHSKSKSPSQKRAQWEQLMTDPIIASSFHLMLANGIIEAEIAARYFSPKPEKRMTVSEIARKIDAPRSWTDEGLLAMLYLFALQDTDSARIIRRAADLYLQLEDLTDQQK